MLHAGVALTIFAGPASAATVRLIDVPDGAPCEKYQPQDCGDRRVPLLVYAAGHGEANRVRVAARAGTVRIRDLGATVRPGRGCSRIGAHRARCEIPDALAGVYVATRGGPDRLISELDPTIGLFVDGGSGNDVVVGGRGGDRLFGGRGADVLRGRDGQDLLYDAAPRRTFRAGDPSPFAVDPVQPTVPLAGPGAGRDSFDGGRGRDYVSYAGRSAGVTVDLATRAPLAGQRGERDSIVGVEHATGGAGDDRLKGNREANELRAGGGDDRVAGRAGDDYLEGSSGRNVLSGGLGDDQITGGTGERERFACGPGVDSVFNVDPVDLVGADCERRR